MAFVSELFDQMRDLLDDAADTQVPFVTKKLYLNRGIAKMWPRVYRLATTNVAILTGAIEDLTLSAIDDGHILSVEYSVDSDADNYVKIDRFYTLPGDEEQDVVLYLGFQPQAGASLRIIHTAPVPLIAAASYAAAQSETWVGPDRLMGLPVLYAMGMAAARKLDNRQDHTRMSTTQALNGVTDQDIMGAAQMWFGQFEAELDDLERPLPIARG